MSRAKLARMVASSASLTLLDFPSPKLAGWESFSPFVLQVSRALKLAKLRFEHRHLPLLRLPFDTPHGQLPVLHVDGEVVADSTRIMHRIEQELAPGVLTRGLDERARAEAWLWEEFSDTALYPYPLASRWQDDRHWPAYRAAMFGEVPAPLRAALAAFVRRSVLGSLVGRDFTRTGLDACYARMERVLDALEERAPHYGFWLGVAPSVADLGLFAHLHVLRAPIAPATAESVGKRKRLSAYLDRVHAATS